MTGLPYQRLLKACVIKPIHATSAMCDDDHDVNYNNV